MSLRGFASGMSEALTRVSRQYRDIAEAQQAGGYEVYACGVWIRGLSAGHFERLKTIVDHPEAVRSGWWDAATGPRRTTFFAMAVEASNPSRAALRCMEELNRRLEDMGLGDKPEAIRFEVELLPDEFHDSL